VFIFCSEHLSAVFVHIISSFFSLYIRYIFTIYICWSGWDGEE
jgi:hypothetical protein